MSRNNSAKQFDSRYPSIEDLRNKAKKRIPRFAFEYLDSGCNEEVNLRRNTREIREVQLTPNYLDNFTSASLKTELFGHVYDAPFGVAPIGLQGLIWPNASEILAKAAFELTAATPVAPQVYEVGGRFIVATLKQKDLADMSLLDETKRTELKDSVLASKRQESLDLRLETLKKEAGITVSAYLLSLGVER